MADSFDLETRKKIFQLIERHPGLNLSTIAQMLQMNVPLVDYHTRYFEKHELVSVIKDSGFKRYYVKGSVGAPQQRLFEVLRQEIPLRIVLFLLITPKARYPKICECLPVSRSTVSYHLKKLIRSKVVEVVVEDGEWVYQVVDEKLIVDFLMRYKPGGVLKRFKDTWDDFGKL